MRTSPVHDDEPTVSSGPATLAQQDEPHQVATRFSLLIYHRDGSQIVALQPGSSLIVGRARPADVAIRDRSLSRQHARFDLLDEQLWVEDLGSTNGTRVNGRRITRTRAKQGDAIVLGSVRVALHRLHAAADGSDGLESHDSFITRLEQQLASARTFDRPLVVMMVRAATQKDGHVSGWAPRLRRRLRPADAIALYGPCELLIALAETEQQHALIQAEQMVGGRLKSEPQLLVGLATYPRDGVTAEQLIENALTAVRQASRRKPIQLTDRPGAAAKASRASRLIVNSPKIAKVFETARRVAESEIPVLISGETGSGKEVLARVIHKASARHNKQLQCLNCGAIPANLVESALFGHERGAFTGAERQTKGLFEEANGGMVLLDEIGELPPSAQTALLRVLETKRVSRVGSATDFAVDIRVVAATHRDLEAMCEAGDFRWDLYYRLNAITLELPPLRERKADIFPLAEQFVVSAAKANRSPVSQIDPAARQALEAYSWPGNVRELRNAIERAVVIAQEQTITVEDLPERVRRSQSEPAPPPSPPTGELDIKERLRQYEGQLLLEALKTNDWNQTQTAKALNMPLRTLVHKIRQHGLKKRYEG